MDSYLYTCFSISISFFLIGTDRKAFAFRHISASQENSGCPSPPSPSLQNFASNIHNSAKQRDAETSTRKGAAVENARILSMSASKGSSHFDRNVTEDPHARKGSLSAPRSNRSEVTTKEDLELKKSRVVCISLRHTIFCS